MPSGTVRSIHVARSAGLPVDAPSEALAVAGRGLDGDCCATGFGLYSNKPEPGRRVTLIAVETLAELEHVAGVRPGPGQHRRSLVTAGGARLVGPDRPHGGHTWIRFRQVR